MIVRGRDGVQPSHRRQAVGFPELTAEMALVGKSAGSRHVCAGQTRNQKTARLFQAAEEQLPIGAGAEHGAKVP